jgi:hypothetical protein
MTINSQADKQPKVYQINLLVDDDTFDEALVAAVETEGGATYTELRTAGTFHAALQAVVLAALTSYLEL